MSQPAVPAPVRQHHYLPLAGAKGGHIRGIVVPLQPHADMAALGMGRAGWLAGAAVRHQHDALVHGLVAAIQDHLQRDAANAKLVQPGAQILGLGTGHHLQFEGRAGRAGQGSGQNQAAGPQCWVQHRGRPVPVTAG
ncbi:hypothetical protein G6F46_014690 [Rhizopus delemar]|nr:hypothetical protein G6F46_014690 [Rhizopus delemar]